MHETASGKLKVFLCHASQDKPYVRTLYQKLRAEGMEPWLDEESLLPGQNWNVEIHTALRTSDAIIVCLSNHAVTKAGYVQKEIKLSLDVADEQPDGEIFLIPARIEPCEIPHRLAHLQSPEIFEGKGYQHLIEALKIRATKLHRRLDPPVNATDVGTGIRSRSSISDSEVSTGPLKSNFRDAFAQVFWERHPNLRRKSQQSFTVSFVGETGTGKTALAYVLTGTEVNFLSLQTASKEPYSYRLPFRDAMAITDHLSHTMDPRHWRESLEYLERHSDLVFFFTSPDQQFRNEDKRALAELEILDGTALALVANKIDLLQPSQIGAYLYHLREATNYIPLPVSVAESVNLDLFVQFILKGRQLYS